jgi:chemotaxis protein MotB
MYGIAGNVGKFLIERDGVAPGRVSTAAYGQYRPLAPNISEANRSRNRRVDIVIVNTTNLNPIQEKKQESKK